MKEEINQLYQLAVKARLKAHAPYSKFLVGAAVKFKGQKDYFVGCNVENASYGGTVCAERTAIFAAIAKLGKQEIESIVVVTDTSPASPPCGFCLQVISEFAGPEAEIYLANLQGIEKKYTFNQLLPVNFKFDHVR